MNKRIVRAALVACLLSSAAAVAVTAPLSSAYAADTKVTSATGKLLAPAQKLMEANDFAGALVLVKQAAALPDLPAFDVYKINEFLGNIYIRENDHVNAEIAFVAMAESPALPPEDRSNTFRIAGLLSTEQKHYDQGIKYDNAFIALGGAPDPLLLASLSQAYYYKDDFANAETTALKVISATPAGEAPNRGALEILFGVQLKAKKTEAAVGTLEQIVTYYDDHDEWGQLVDVSLGTKGIKDIDAVHIYRLRLATKATGKSEDYTIAAAMALSVGYPVEAQSILDAGQAAGALDGSGKTNAQVAETRGRASKDRATIAGFDALARKSATGEFELKLAETYYGYGRYAEAADAAGRAISKGGAKTDANEANMVLGESLLMQGKTAEAVAAFNAVHGAGPGMMKAQHLWLLYANRKYAVAAPAPAH